MPADSRVVAWLAFGYSFEMSFLSKLFGREPKKPTLGGEKYGGGEGGKVHDQVGDGKPASDSGDKS